MDAICRGEEMDPLLARLKQEEIDKKALLTELDHLTKLGSIVQFDETKLRQELRRRVADAKGLLGRHVRQARQMLRKVLIEPLQCIPIDPQGQPAYRVIAKGTCRRLLPIHLANCVASPTRRDEICTQSWVERLERLRPFAKNGLTYRTPLFRVS